MNCGMDCIKYLIFIFNFVFALGGLAVLVVGVLIKLNQADVLAIFEGNVPSQLSLPANVLIAVGAIIFIIAFFGCCGAARESHCMIITFAVLLLTLLVIQVAIAAFAWIEIKDNTFDKKFNEKLKHFYDKYDDGSDKLKQKAVRDTINSIQALMSCCGYISYRDFGSQIPYSCCGKHEKEFCSEDEVKGNHNRGCKDVVLPQIHTYINTLAGLALAIAAIELFGVIFSFCLANSIRNVERRGYKV